MRKVDENIIMSNPLVFITDYQEVRVFEMGMSKRDLCKQVQNIKKRIEELEGQVRLDPLKKNPAIHEELEKLRKKL